MDVRTREAPEIRAPPLPLKKYTKIIESIFYFQKLPLNEKCPSSVGPVTVWDASTAHSVYIPWALVYIVNVKTWVQQERISHCPYHEVNQYEFFLVINIQCPGEAGQPDLHIPISCSMRFGYHELMFSNWIDPGQLTARLRAPISF